MYHKDEDKSFDEFVSMVYSQTGKNKESDGFTVQELIELIIKKPLLPPYLDI